MQPIVEVSESSIHGRGVFATRDVRAWTPVARCGDVRSALAEPPDWAPPAERDVTADPDDPFQFLNHSCDPNSFLQSVGGTSYVFTRRPVAAGEEVVVDYRLNATFEEEVECRCGADCCTGSIRLDFFSLPEPAQLRRLPLLEDWFVSAHADRLRGVVEARLPE